MFFSLVIQMELEINANTDLGRSRFLFVLNPNWIRNQNKYGSREISIFWSFLIQIESENKMQYRQIPRRSRFVVVFLYFKGNPFLETSILKWNPCLETSTSKGNPRHLFKKKSFPGNRLLKETEFSSRDL